MLVDLFKNDVVRSFFVLETKNVLFGFAALSLREFVLTFVKAGDILGDFTPKDEDMMRDRSYIRKGNEYDEKV